MRLLRRNDDGSLSLIQCPEYDVPPYAILSHTWIGDHDEVTFDDITEGNPERKALSYKKIKFCAEQAARDGLRYSWVDTCCINKSSSAELQEAITRMFAWYRNAARCYVYLSDVLSMQDSQWETAFRNSRWFTRGWTLQELIAPSCVEFFAFQGTRLGDKKSLESMIHDITRIPCQALRSADIADFSVAERLSWAENRQTQLEEDKAYSLLGLFGIFIPLIYGEGSHALIRLKNEIQKEEHADIARQQDLLSRLPTAPQAAFNSFENQHASACLPGTRNELLRAIMEWICGPDNSCIFWLNGIAGTGKSTVAQTVARECHEKGSLGASFFFARGGGDVSRADKLFTSLAWQLATKVPRLKRHISSAITEQEGIVDQSLRDQWDQLILKPLSCLGRDSCPLVMVIVIDALDECDSERDIRIVLRLLSSATSLNNVRLKFFITSRPEIPIRCSFFQIPLVERQMFVLHDILPAVVDHDISVFFENNLGMIRTERGFHKSWPGMNIVKRLVEISGGLFIWAATACRFIRDGRQLATKRILNLLGGQYFRGGPEKKLDEIYTTVLRSCIQADYDDEEKKEVYGMLREVLGGIVVLFSPLSIDSLSHLLLIPSSDINETLADCHAILSVPSQFDLPIRPHHPTFRDFLFNKNRCYDADFCVDEKVAQNAMAENCIRLLSKMLKRDICGLRSPGTLIQDVDPNAIRQGISPVLEYASRYWVQHYREGGARPHDGCNTHRFLENHLLHWIELMSLMGHASEIPGIVRMYEALLPVSDAVLPHWQQPNVELLTDFRSG